MSLLSPTFRAPNQRRSSPQIQHLNNAISNSDRVINRSDNYLANYQFLLQVLKEKYNDDADALIAKLYYDAFQISITHDDQARASRFVKKNTN